MSNPDQQSSGGDPRVQPATSEPNLTGSALNYTVVAQNAAEVQHVSSSPAISMAAYLADREQMRLLPTISIYAERGTDRDHIRLLYMNAAALRIWKEMGMHPTEIGMRHRPARTAVLSFGVPFSE